MRKAAEARAELDALKKSSMEESSAETTGANQAATARNSNVNAIQRETTALGQLGQAAKQANVQTTYGGRDSMQQHLSDLQTETNLTTLLNRQHWLGFSSPQQAFSFMQQQYQQKLLSNRADFAGYQTADQYLGYLQRQIASYSQLAAAIRTRQTALQAETAAMLANSNAARGTHDTISQLGEAGSTVVTNLNAYNDALNNVPDTVETAAVLDTSQAMADLAKYRAELAATPVVQHTALSSSQTRGAVPLLSGANLDDYQAALAQVPEHIDTDARFDIASAIARVNQLRAAYATVPRIISTAGVTGGSGLGESLTEDITPTFDSGSVDEEFQQLAASMAELRGDAQRVPITPRVNIEPAEAELHKLSQTEHVVVDETTTPVAVGGSAGGVPPPTVPPVTGGGSDEDDEEFRKLQEDMLAADAAERKLARDIAVSDFGPNPNDARAWEQLELAVEGFGDTLRDTSASSGEQFQQLTLDVEHFAGTVGDGLGPNPNDARAFEELAEEIHATTAEASASISALRDLAVSADTAAEASRYAYAANTLQTASQRALGTTAESMVARYAALAAGSNDAAKAAQFANAAQQLLASNLFSTRNEAAELGDALLAAGRAADSSGEDASRSGGRWGFLTKQLTLFGGFFGDTALLGEVAVWHVLLDGFVEIFALWIPALVTATAGLVAWGAAAYRSGKEVAEQLSNAYTVGQALNRTVPPLTDNFAKMAQAVKPQVYELFGDALDVMNSRSGVFNQLIQQTGSYLERFASRVVIDMQSGKNGFQDFLQTGEKDLALIGQGFDSLGMIIGRFIAATALTHIAEDLAGIGDAILKVVADVLKIVPTPVLALVLGLHGLALWGGLAVTAMTKLSLAVLGLMSRFDALNSFAFKTADFLGATTEQLTRMAERAPEVEAVMAAISDPQRAAQVGQLATYIQQTGQSFEDFARSSGPAASAKLDELSEGLDESGRSTVALGMAAGATAPELEKLAGTAAEGAGKTGLWAGAMNLLKGVSTGAWIAIVAVAVGAAAYAIATAKDATQDWIVQMDKALSSSSVYGVIGQTVSDLAAATDKLAIAQKTGVGNAGELSAAQNDLSGKLQAELTHVGNISHAYGVSMPAALALAQTAGVSVSQLFSTQNSVWSEAQQQIKGLVTGYQAMGQQMGAIGSDMNVLAVSESTQISNMGKLNDAYDTFTKTVAGAPSSLITTAQGFDTFATAAKAAGASMTGLNSPSLKLQSDFQSNYSNVEQLFDAFRNTQALSGGGNFTAFVKDAVAALLPMTGGSKEAVAQVSALAQEAGGPATTSLASLQKWVGNVKDPLLQMKKASDQAAIGASDLSQDAQRLSTTLQQELDPAMAKASFGAYGGQAAFSKFADYLVKFGPKAQPTIDAGKAVAQELLSVDKNSSQAKAQFVGWAESMGLSKTQANQLWSEVSKGESPMKNLSKNLADGATGANQLGKSLGKSGLLGQMRDLSAQGFGDIGDFFTKTLPGDAKYFGQQMAADWSSFYTTFMRNFGSPVTHAILGIPATLKSDGESFAQTWITAYQSFERDLYQPLVRALLDIPDTLESDAQAFAQTWVAAWQSFDRDLIEPVIRWLTVTVPDNLSRDAQVFAQTWIAAWQSFDRNLLQPVQRALTSTIPGWLNSLGAFIRRIWDAAWSDFVRYVYDPLYKFLNSTAHDWLSSLGTKFRSTWSTAWSDFQRDLLSPMESFFTRSLPSAISSGLRTGINEAIAGIDKVIGFINNDVLAHLPGGLKIPTVSKLAAGGVAPARLGGSIPGTGDEDGTHIIAMGGEYMLRKPARMALEQAYGPNFLNTLNQADTMLGSGSRGNFASQGTPKSGRYAGGGGILGTVEGILSDVGTGLSGAGRSLAGLVGGGVSALEKLAGEGAKDIFDAVWNHSVKPLVSAIGGGNVGGDIMQDTAAGIKTGIDSFLTGQDSKASSAAAIGGPGGSVTPGLVSVAKYVMSHGGNKNAGAGVAGVVAGESSGNPEAVEAGGGGGEGLIQWTPGSTARPYQPIVTGNAAKDMSTQLADMMEYISGRGGIGEINSAGSAMGAAEVFSRMEAPLVPGSDIRASVVAQMAAEGYAAGNVVLSAIEQATGNEHQREAMALGSWLSSRWNPKWSKNGYYGAFQIPVSKTVTIADADNPLWAAKHMLPAYSRAVNAVGTKLWSSTPSQAAILAAQVAQGVNFTRYQGASELSTGWKAVEEALGASGPAKTSTAATGSSSSMSATDAWSYYAKLLPTDVTNESSAFYALSGHTLPTGKGKATTEQWAQWHALLGILQTNQLKAIGQNQGGDYEKLTNATDNWSLPGGASESLWTQFTTDLTNQYNWIRDDPTPPSSVWGWEPKSTWPAKFKDSKGRAPGHIPPSGWAAWKYENGLWSSAVKALSTLHATEAGAQKAWNGLWGPSGSITKSAPTPGISVQPVGSSGPINVNLDSLIQGGPAAPVFDVTGGSLSGTGSGFAAGGSLSDVAGMFAMGGSIPMTIAPAGGDGLVSSLTQANNRTLSDAANRSSVGLQVQGDLNINNPRPERPSESITRSSNRLAFLAGRGVA